MWKKWPLRAADDFNLASIGTKAQKRCLRITVALSRRWRDNVLIVIWNMLPPTA
jgi:hypothetical protein